MDKFDLNRKYNQTIAEDKKRVSALEKEISILKKSSKKDKKISPYFRLGIVGKLLETVSLRIKMSNESKRMLGVKKMGILDIAKKDIYKIFSELEQVVTLEMGESLDFNRKQLDAIKLFNPKQKLNLHKHLKKSIQQLIQSYGENTKWKWSFPYLWAKLAVVTKNIYDFREAQKKRDPRYEFFYDLQEHLQAIKDSLFFAATEYANKFRLSTKSPSDIIYAVKLLEYLKRVCIITGDDLLMKKCKSGIDSYRATLEAEEKEKERKRIRMKK